MNKEEIQLLFNKFNQLNVLIIGDVMVDAYLVGKVARISPEAPVPIVSVNSREHRLGGAANVGLNIRSLGAKAFLCSVIGEDERGKIFLDLLKKRNLTDEGILVSRKRKTTVKTRVISQHQHLLRVDDEIDAALHKELENMLYEKIQKIIAHHHIHAVIFQDYDKGAITPFVIKKTVVLAREKNIPVLVDPKKRNFHNYQGVTLFKPNFKELTEGLKTEVSKTDFEKIDKIAKTFLEKHQIQSLLITLSEQGLLYSDQTQYHHIPAQIRDISDVSGAGDTVVSVASLCLAAGTAPDNTAAIANISGGLVCEKVGVVPVDKNRLFQETIKYFEKKSVY